MSCCYPILAALRLGPASQIAHLQTFLQSVRAHTMPGPGLTDCSFVQFAEAQRESSYGLFQTLDIEKEPAYPQQYDELNLLYRSSDIAGGLR